MQRPISIWNTKRKQYVLRKNTMIQLAAEV